MNLRNDRLPEGWESWLSGLGPTPRARLQEWARRFGVSERTARRWANDLAAPAHVAEQLRREMANAPTPIDQAFEALSYVEQVVRVASAQDERFLRRALTVIGAAASAALLANDRRLHPALTPTERDGLVRSVKLLGFEGSDGQRTTGPSIPSTTDGLPELGAQLKTAPIKKRKPEPETET